MTYERPELVTLGSACAAIQGGFKDGSLLVDISMRGTDGAYESDQ